MKLVLCFLLLAITLQIPAQTFDVEAIKLEGANDKRINLVFMGDGYTAFELDQFITDATNFSSSLFGQSPFTEYAAYFNVYAIKVISNESGTDHPGTATDVTEPVIDVKFVDNYFNTSFDTANIHRLLYTYDSATVYDVLADNFPEYDQPVILVNTSEYGGAGGPYATSSTGTSADEIVIHELGHSLFDLKDEYYPGDALAGEAINMTQETNTSLVKWKNWIGTSGVGIYPYGTSGNAATWNRPHQNCKMRYLGVPFCSVCKEGIVEKIHSLISPIDAYTPNNTTVDEPTFPLDFQLDLIKPIPNTLESEWTLNTVSFASNVDEVSVLETDLVEGANTLTAVIHDNTPFLRVDNHESVHIHTVTWTINYSSLGINDIESELNNYTISMYPNPTNNILIVTLESNSSSNLKIEIMSLDGKKVKSTSISNYENTPIDISHFSEGVYVSNFYSGNILIASKRLVKN
ncbi:M64 family metallopeptidase [Algibacter luteus]|uniref:Por secretion system C-terminal sorting domain-containing protein n=1 Tax=Algibacter luteus TaxID=1178825 RepID=A0A1M6AGZ3_9FLAO|nr:M64 family metallopeptidase [Algibacter luteus]SHI35588.1 Por secretion system C-terminal sorting domain-containing protein [Algibacter luteus]